MYTYMCPSQTKMSDLQQSQADAWQDSLHWPETDVRLLYQQGGMGWQTMSAEGEV